MVCFITDINFDKVGGEFNRGMWTLQSIEINMSAQTFFYSLVINSTNFIFLTILWTFHSLKELIFYWTFLVFSSQTQSQAVVYTGTYIFTSTTASADQSFFKDLSLSAALFLSQSVRC